MKGKRSYAEVVKNGSNSVLTAANNVPIRQKKTQFSLVSSFQESQPSIVKGSWHKKGG